MAAPWRDYFAVLFDKLATVGVRQDVERANWNPHCGDQLPCARKARHSRSSGSSTINFSTS